MDMVEPNNTIVVDTSVLLAIYEVKKDPFEDLNIKEIYIPGPVIKELEKLEKSSKKYGAAKRLIFKLLSLYNIILGKEDGTFADEVILNLAKKYNLFFTNDKMLKKDLKKAGAIVYSFGESGVYR